MARTFSSNRFVTASNIVGTRINGAAAVTIAAWVKYATTSATAASDNRILTGPVNSTSAGFLINLNNNSSPGNVRFFAGARSQSADSLQTATTSTNLSAGTWYHVAAVLDVAGDKIRTYVNGGLENTQSVTFGANTYTLGTPSENEGIGATATGAGQLNGTVADLAVWTADLTTAGILRLAGGERPVRVTPASLQLFWPLYGDASEADVIRGSALTAGGTGTPAAAAHPPMKQLFTGAGVA